MKFAVRRQEGPGHTHTKLLRHMIEAFVDLRARQESMIVSDFGDKEHFTMAEATALGRLSMENRQ